MIREREKIDKNEVNCLRCQEVRFLSGTSETQKTFQLPKYSMRLSIATKLTSLTCVTVVLPANSSWKMEPLVSQLLYHSLLDYYVKLLLSHTRKGAKAEISSVVRAGHCSTLQMIDQYPLVALSDGFGRGRGCFF